jgi:hypothetical protein
MCMGCEASFKSIPTLQVRVVRGAGGPAPVPMLRSHVTPPAPQFNHAKALSCEEASGSFLVRKLATDLHDLDDITAHLQAHLRAGSPYPVRQHSPIQESPPSHQSPPSAPEQGHQTVRESDFMAELASHQERVRLLLGSIGRQDDEVRAQEPHHSPQRAFPYPLHPTPTYVDEQIQTDAVNELDESGRTATLAPEQHAHETIAVQTDPEPIPQSSSFQTQSQSLRARPFSPASSTTFSEAPPADPQRSSEPVPGQATAPFSLPDFFMPQDVMRQALESVTRARPGVCFVFPVPIVFLTIHAFTAPRQVLPSVDVFDKRVCFLHFMSSALFHSAIRTGA